MTHKLQTIHTERERGGGGGEREREFIDRGNHTQTLNNIPTLNLTLILFQKF